MSITTGLGREEVGYNYLVNSSFLIWQRATSQTTIGYGSDDRWRNDHDGSTKTHSRQNSTDTERAFFNSPYYSRTVVSSVTGAGNRVVKWQPIEDVTKLAGKTVAISFWAKADSSKNISIETFQTFGTGGSPSTGVSLGGQKIALTSTWQKKTLTTTFPNLIGKTLGTDGVHTSFTSIFFWFDAGSDYNARTDSLGQQSGTFDIAEVKLEVGSVATPFSLAGGSIGGEEELCQRYCQRISGLVGVVGSTSTAVWRMTGNLLTKLRKDPNSLTIVGTVSLFNAKSGLNVPLSSIGVAYYTPNAIQFDGVTGSSIGGTQGDTVVTLNSNSGYILVDAEL
jgi:hypothetical protein